MQKYKEIDQIMPAPQAHTLEEHRDYLHQIVRLQLFFLHRWLTAHPEESFRDAIRNRVDIYRKTDANPGPMTPSVCFFDAPAWKSMEDEAEALFRRFPDDGSAFENHAFEVFRKSLDARCERDYLDESSLSACQCGSLRYETSLQPDGETVNFHIANAVAPQSIFSDPDYLKNCFFELMNQTEHTLGARRIATSSWLNSHPRWLALFPQEWHERMEAENRNIQWHYGFWGQFINARNTFNRKYGQILRETGEFPFYPRKSSCSIVEMRKFLRGGESSSSAAASSL